MSTPSAAAGPLVREALALGFTLRPGSRHWLAAHPCGGRAIVPYGRRYSSNTERRVIAKLRQAARLEVP